MLVSRSTSIDTLTLAHISNFQFLKKDEGFLGIAKNIKIMVHVFLPIVLSSS